MTVIRHRAIRVYDLHMFVRGAGDLTAAEFAKSPDLADFSGRVSGSGEGRWTVLAAVNTGVPASVIAASRYERFESRDNGLFTAKVLSALHPEFGWARGEESLRSP